jgi:hypothetical protein
MMTEPQVVDLLVRKSSDFWAELQVSDETGSTLIDFTGATLLMDVRNGQQGPVVMSLSTDNGMLVTPSVADPSVDPNVRIEIAWEALASDTVKVGTYGYDVVMVTGDYRTRLWTGQMTIKDGFTR